MCAMSPYPEVDQGPFPITREAIAAAIKAYADNPANKALKPRRGAISKTGSTRPRTASPPN
jgi:hypothetical protein